jgi:hypothetical protein
MLPCVGRFQFTPIPSITGSLFARTHTTTTSRSNPTRSRSYLRFVSGRVDTGAALHQPLGFLMPLL